MKFSEIRLGNLNETLHEIACRKVTKLNPILVYDKEANNFSIESGLNDFPDKIKIITTLRDGIEGLTDEVADDAIYIGNWFQFGLFMNIVEV